MFARALLGLALIAPAAAADTPPAEGDKKFPEYAAFLKGAKPVDGLLTLHQKDDHVYAELLPAQLDKPYLLPIAVARGGGLGGTLLNFGEEWVVAFKRVGDKIFVVRRNVRFTAKAGTPLAKAVETTYADSVLVAVPIKALNPAKQSVVIDLNDIFFSDLADLGFGAPDRNRTTWGKVKAFKKNVELQVAVTFTAGRGGKFAGFLGGTDEVIDARGTTVVVNYGLLDLPDAGYQPRYADDRVGHFVTAVKDFSTDNPDTAFVRMVNRWRLDRADGSPWTDNAKLVPPKKKIVFWIENSVPDEYRSAVRAGILEWNKAFEKVGFRDAIEVRQQEGEEFDPEDAAYSTFRWIASDFGYASGPSRANPLTGEIIDADILFDASMVRYYKAEARLFRDDKGNPVEPASPIQAAARGWELPLHPLALRGDAAAADPDARAWRQAAAARTGLCRCATHKQNELALAVMHAAAAAGLKHGDRVTDEIMQQAVKEVAMHEVGHTLGLRHNFKASGMLPNDQLHDTAVTRKRGLVGSVMDYNPANIATKGAPQGDYFTTTLGPYDYWAIEYAYRPLAGGPDGEKAELAKIAARAAEPALSYGTDEDLTGTPDPLVNVWDLGADPLAFARDRVAIAREMTNGLADRVTASGEGYQRTRASFGVVMHQYGDAAFLAAKFVGGVAVHRDHRGDPHARDPLAPVSPDRQREALRFLQETVLTDVSFQFPPDLLRKLAADRWMHWGNERAATAAVEYPANEQVLAVQGVALGELFSPGTLRRVQNAARSGDPGDNPLTVAEVFRAVSDAVFADLPGADGKLPAAKSSVVMRNLQRAYLAKLGALATGRAGDVPADARSLARLHLKESARRMEAALKAEGDDTVRAHLEESRDRVSKVLSATLTTGEP